MKRIFKILLFSLISINVFGTAQIPDLLIYNGDTLLLHSCPLGDYPNQDFITPQNLFGSNGCSFTACWRNYIATWEIINSELYLCEIKNVCYPMFIQSVGASFVDEDSIGSEYADLKALFPDKFKDGKVKADWVNRKMIAPKGKLLYYIHAGFESIYEIEFEFHIKKGQIIETKIFDNTKTKKSEYKDDETLRRFVYSNIRWKKLPKQEKPIKVYVEFSANEKGFIDVAVIRKGYNKIFDKEALRVIKSIPNWEIVYKHGEFSRNSYIFQIEFSEEKQQKYKKN